MEARLERAFDRAKPRQATLVGTKGRIVVDELHRPQRATVFVDGKEPAEIVAPYEHDDFFSEIHHFVGLVETGATESPIMSLDDSIRCAEIIDTIRSRFAVTPAALYVLVEQERKLRYPSTFGADEAFELGSAVSGLHEGRDHELIVRALEKVLGVSMPSYPCVTV